MDESLAEKIRRRRIVMARVGHLIPRKQVEIERAVRLLRAHFVDRRQNPPKRGTVHRMMLVGRYAQPGPKPDCETGEINEYELRAFVYHDAYTGDRKSVVSGRRGYDCVLLAGQRTHTEKTNTTILAHK